MKETKQTGDFWIHDIPINWKLLKAGYLFIERSAKADGTETPLSLSQKDGLVKTDEMVEHAMKSKTYDGWKKVWPNDLVLNRFKAHLGVFFCSKYSGMVSFHYGVFIPKKDLVVKYFEYLFHSKIYCDMFSELSNGMTVGLQNLGNASFYSAKCIFPPVDEQQQIVAFLDSKCAEIDALSADIQSEIDTLEAYKRSVITEAVTKGLDKNVPMKDSGIEWVGDIPAHWGVEKGKYCLRYEQKPTKPEDDVITCFRDGEVTLRKNRREDGFTISLKEIGYQGIDVGDLIVHGMDGFAGAIGISDSRGKASPVLNVLNTAHNKRYIMYYLRSLAFNGVFLALATGIRVRTCDTNWGKLRELLYILPPKEEQEAIVAYIDGRLNAVDEIIAQEQEQLAVLADYKSSLIYEYVTGKKEVPVA